MSNQSSSVNDRETTGLTNFEIDTIGEILNISMGAAATAISLMLNRQVVITTPSVKVVRPNKMDFQRLEPALGIEIQYIDGLPGSNIMIMSVKDARAIVGLLLEDSGGMDSVDSAEMDELQTSALGEIMNQMMGASSTALATFLNREINISPPKSFDIDTMPERFSSFMEQEYIVSVTFRFEVENLLDSEFITVMPVEFTRALVQSAMDMDGDPEPAHEETQPQAGEPESQTGYSQLRAPIDASTYQQAEAPREPAREDRRPPARDEYREPLREDRDDRREPPRYRDEYREPPRYRDDYREPPRGYRDDEYRESPRGYRDEYREPPRYRDDYREPPREARISHGHVGVKPLQFDSLDEESDSTPDQVSLNLVMDIDLNMVVEIGRVKKQVKDVVALHQGSVIELEKQAGEPVDIMVNGKLIARGDVVVIGDNFGVRVTEIVDTAVLK